MKKKSENVEWKKAVTVKQFEKKCIATDWKKKIKVKTNASEIENMMNVNTKFKDRRDSPPSIECPALPITTRRSVPSDAARYDVPSITYQGVLPKTFSPPPTKSLDTITSL